ncbi:MAG: hypothetical protein MRY57_01265 [Candidatus Pacebacteria bacterium]|nr:hypothetical protein [Candidatus Paceibacterota bacterium]
MKSSLDRLIENSKVEKVSWDEIFHSREYIHRKMEKDSNLLNDEVFPDDIIFGGC